MRAFKFGTRTGMLIALLATLHGSARADDGNVSVISAAAEPHDSGFQEPTAHWRLVEELRFYLQRPPGSLTGAYRTQGMATDGHHWFFSWQYGLEIADNHFHSILRNSSIEPPLNLTPGIPADLLAQGLNHIGDIDYHDGIIYASLDSTAGFMNGHVALYSAADLSYTGVTYSLTGAPSNPKHDIASWVAIDGLHNRGYGKEYQLGNTINVYRLHNWTFDHVVTLDMALERIQGAKVHGEWLYMSSDNSTHSIYRANLRTGHVEELFRLPTPAGHLEVEGIGLRAGREETVDIYVEMVVDPDNSGADLSNPDIHVSLFHYRARGRDL